MGGDFAGMVARTNIKSTQLRGYMLSNISLCVVLRRVWYLGGGSNNSKYAHWNVLRRSTRGWVETRLTSWGLREKEK